MPPRDDALDAVIYAEEGLRHLQHPIYVPLNIPENPYHWIKQLFFEITKDKKENNIMYMPGKLKETLRRIFGAQDPLDYIEDARITSTFEEDKVELTLRVPRNLHRYVPSESDLLKTFGICTKDEAYAKVGMGEWGKVYSVDLPQRIHFSGPKTILIWPDGTKTIVSCGEGEEFDEYAGFCAALVKKLFGSTTAAKKFLKKVRVEDKPKKVKKVKTENAPEVVEYEFTCNAADVFVSEYDEAPRTPKKKKQAVNVGDCMVATDIPRVDNAPKEDC